MRRILGMTALIAAVLFCGAPLARAQGGPQLGSVDWTKRTEASGLQTVRFHLHWTNPGTGSSTVPVQGSIKSQEFGVFLPDYGPIGDFSVPPLAPASFFDVFFDVPLSQLPPEPEKRLPAGQSPSLSAGRTADPASLTDPAACLPDTIWDGNVDVVWTGTGVTGQVYRHFGDLPVCPGGGPSYIHVRSTDCPVGAPWSVTGLCADFAVTLVNEDLSPGPNPIPPGWTGFIRVTAVSGVTAGTVCCPILHFDCDSRPAELELCATACPCNPQAPTLGQVDWHNVGTAVRFHLQWVNESPNAVSPPVSGMMHSQEFGVFLPDFGPIGAFNVPPLQPNSFFDVFFDVPLDALPPEPMKIMPGGTPGLFASTASARGVGPASATAVPCPPDTIWDGNVDIIWSAAGSVGQIQRHFGDLIVCPGGGPSLIHVKSTTCPVGAPWSVLGLCPGFSVTLLNEDHSPAPNPIPPGWTGFISITATAAVTPGTVCCPVLHFDCAGAPADIDLCATACDCGTQGPVLGQVDWHTIGALERFHLRFENPSPNGSTVAVQGSLSSQEFGVFLPDFGPIGGFNVPPIAPNSFFDVFIDVPLAQLPAEPNQIMPGGGPPVGVPCPSDTIWDGNVDIQWSGSGAAGQVNRHFGDLIVCPGSGRSFIHFFTNCTLATPWSVTGLCPGFNATLVNEDLSPAPNPVPAGWTGFIAVSAAAGTAPGTTCCFSITFDCAGSPGVIDLCATACECANTASVRPADDLGFGIRSTVPSPTSGVVMIEFVIPQAAATTLSVYDATGRRVRTLQDAPLPAGRHLVMWDGRGQGGLLAPAGTYFVKLTSGERAANSKLIMVR